MEAQTSLLDEIVVDNFAGGGGASIGIELALGKPVTIAVNHDQDAVRMHITNHPFTRHYCEDVWTIDPVEVCEGHPVALAWFSPDCKHFSRAKGGKPANRKTRGLAWVVLRWAALVRPRVIMLENVEEFQTWGPVRKGKPVKAKAGQTFQRWKKQLEGLGYRIETKVLRACDYGAATSRSRFFVVARCDLNPIRWPAKTHGDPTSVEVRSGKQQPWKTAADIIDWSLPTPSIFSTAKEIRELYGLRAVRPLAENTMQRIARGIMKFVIEDPSPFLVQCNHTGGNRVQSVGQPIPTITGKHGYGIVTPFLVVNNEHQLGTVPNEPLRTITTGGHHALAMPFLIQYHSEIQKGQVRGQELTESLHTVDASNRFGLTVAFMTKFYNGGYHGAGNHATEPLSTVTAVDHNAIATANLIQFNRQSVGQSSKQPSDTVISMARFGVVYRLLEKYCPEVKARYGDTGLVTLTVSGQSYAIVDIGLRMLTPQELFRASGFPPDYRIEEDLEGKTYTRAAQVARCGNAVPPQFAEALVRANFPNECGEKIVTMSQLFDTIAV